MALGATPGRVRADVLRRALLVCLAGAVVGIGLALAASHASRVDPARALRAD